MTVTRKVASIHHPQTVDCVKVPCLIIAALPLLAIQHFAELLGMVNGTNCAGF